MRLRAGATTHCRRISAHVLVVALAAISTGSAHASDSPAETERLATMLRQLDALDRIVHSRPPTEAIGRSRYYFDYARLEADIARIRAGIDDYLRPSRAQPRDPDQLIGEYRLPASAP